MSKSLFVSTALAAGLVLAGQMQPAEAAPQAPMLDGATEGALVHEAGWRCGFRRCWWVPNYWGPVPDYALGWGPPHRPNCFWKRGLLGNWKYKCRD